MYFDYSGTGIYVESSVAL